MKRGETENNIQEEESLQPSHQSPKCIVDVKSNPKGFSNSRASCIIYVTDVSTCHTAGTFRKESLKTHTTKYNGSIQNNNDVLCNC